MPLKSNALRPTARPQDATAPNFKFEARTTDGDHTCSGIAMTPCEAFQNPDRSGLIVGEIDDGMFIIEQAVRIQLAFFVKPKHCEVEARS
jgi:hypothetical protein